MRTICREYDEQLIMDLEAYYQDEVLATEFYSRLARMAPDSDSRTILSEMSADERRHAMEMKRAYIQLTGERPAMPDEEIGDISNYHTALMSRFVPETNDYREYGRQFMDQNANWLKNIFFKASMDEAVHAMRLPYLLAKSTEPQPRTVQQMPSTEDECTCE